MRGCHAKCVMAGLANEDVCCHCCPNTAGCLIDQLCGMEGAEGLEPRTGQSCWGKGRVGHTGVGWAQGTWKGQEGPHGRGDRSPETDLASASLVNNRSVSASCAPSDTVCIVLFS